MKKILLSSLAALAVLSGCAQPKASNSGETIVFLGEGNGDYRVTLTSTDQFETGVLTDSKGKKYRLKNAPSGSGVRLANDDGVEIMFSKGDAIVNFGKGSNDIPLTYSESK